MPPAFTSVGRVAAAVARLEAEPFPARLDGGVSGLLAYLAPAVPFGKRLVFANQWLFGPLIKKSLAATLSGNAALRTTTAPTIFRGGDKDNVLPIGATATVNFRLLPGDSVGALRRRVQELINDSQISVRVVGDDAVAERHQHADGDIDVKVGIDVALGDQGPAPFLRGRYERVSGH